MLNENLPVTFLPDFIRERHYTLYELAAAWNCKYDLVRDTFKDRPDVVKLGNPTRNKRTKFHYRIPESVAKRVYEELKRRGGSHAARRV